MALTAERLRELVSYDPEKGIFTSLTDRSKYGGVRISERVGSISHGYRVIWIDGKLYRENRLAFLHTKGVWPVGITDHADGNKQNNRWLNLRDATYSQNSANMKSRTNTASAFKGVTWVKSREKWKAQIKVNYKNIFLGEFVSEVAAYEAYCAAATTHFGEFARVI